MRPYLKRAVLASSLLIGCGPSSIPQFTGPLAAVTDSSLAGVGPRCEEAPASVALPHHATWICTANVDGATVTIIGRADMRVHSLSRMWQFRQKDREESLRGRAEQLIGALREQAQVCDPRPGTRIWRSTRNGAFHEITVDSQTTTVLETIALDSLPPCLPTTAR